MAEIKTARTGASVAEFLRTVEDGQVRADCLALVDLMSAAAGAKPEMWGSSIVGFGTYQLTYADGREMPWMRVGFSPRKANIALYVGCGDPRVEPLLASLGTHSRAKSCLYIRRLSDVHLPTLKTLLAASVRRFDAPKSGDSTTGRSSKPKTKPKPTPTPTPKAKPGVASRAVASKRAVRLTARRTSSSRAPRTIVDRRGR